MGVASLTRRGTALPSGSAVVANFVSSVLVGLGLSGFSIRVLVLD